VEDSGLKRLYPNHPLVAVGAVIICDGRILLEKRKREPDEGKWSIPGGLVELGESLDHAVIREVKEETNLEVEKPVLIDVVENIILREESRVAYHYVIVDYFVKLKIEEFELKAADDAADLRWVKLDEAEDYDLPERLRAFFDRNRRKLEKLDSSL
jgi:8-oxo-dGTP diphosphatase